MRLERKDKKKEVVTNISMNRCKSRRRDEGTSGEVKRDTVFRLKGNEGKGQEITDGCGERRQDCCEMS